MMFTDIQRTEAIAIAELLTSAGRPELIADALREGLTLGDVRRLLAAEAAPVAAPPPRAGPCRPAGGEAELEAAARARFAQQAGRA
jgi:hypothetical protein